LQPRIAIEVMLLGMKENVLIIGAGEIGKAIGKTLRKEKAKIEFWDRNPLRASKQKPLATTVPISKFIFLCVPSWAIRNVLTNIEPYLRKETIVVCLAKGIEEKTQKTMDKVLRELIKNKCQYAFWGGPMLAEELRQDLSGIGVIASKNEKVLEEIGKITNKTNLKIEYSKDVRGVALSGVLKNIYAIGLGVADGLKLGNNFKAWLLIKSVAEMNEIAKKMGAQGQTILGTAGLGDLIATGFSPYSRNREAGEDLVKTGKCCLDSEGVKSLPLLSAMLKKQLKKFPVLHGLHSIIVENKRPQDIFKKLRA